MRKAASVMFEKVRSIVFECAEKGEPLPPTGTIAERVFRGERTVQHALEVLQDNGEIVLLNLGRHLKLPVIPVVHTIHNSRNSGESYVEGE